MLFDFAQAKKTLATSGSGINAICVNGCCYGKDKNSHKFPMKGTDYFKYCGQQFWSFISGDKELYMKIIEPLGHKAKERNDDFQMSYSNMINKFVREFANNFCDSNGAIDWQKLLEFNSKA